jgi:hypothetical protein
MRAQWLLLTLLSAPAWGHSARLLEDAPVLAPSVSPVVTSPEPVSSPWMLQAGAGAGAALISVPASLYLGAWLGNLSNNLYLSLISSMLVMAVVPSVAVAALVTLVGNWSEPGRYRFWPTLGLTAVANILSMVVGTALGLSVGVFGRVALYTLIEAVVLPAAATGSSQLFKRKSGLPQAQAWLSPDPRAPMTWVVPTAEVRF